MKEGNLSTHNSVIWGMWTINFNYGWDNNLLNEVSQKLSNQIEWPEQDEATSEYLRRLVQECQIIMSE